MESKTVAKWLLVKALTTQLKQLEFNFRSLYDERRELTLINNPLISICANIWRHTHK